MRSTPRPPNEDARLAALRALQVLDTPPEERFNRIVRLAQRLFDVPIALITLVDEDRQWYKSRIGIEATEVPRSVGFCPTAILAPEPLIVPNALADPRFADDPSVRGPLGIRFYAGYPLATPDGYRVGTLCIADRRPREITPEDRAALHDLATLAAKELAELMLLETAVERERAVEALATAELHRGLLLNSLPVVLFGVDSRGRFTFSEGADLIGDRPTTGPVVGRSVFDVYREIPPLLDAVRQALAGASSRLQIEIGPAVWDLQLAAQRGDDGAIVGAICVAADVTERERAVADVRRNEQHLRRVLELLPIPIAALDVTLEGKGSLQFVNQRFVALTGYTAEDLPTLDEWYRLVYPDLISRVRAQMQTTALIRQALTEHLDVPPFERSITRRDGRERTVEIKVSFIGNTMLALLTDLTERRAVEREVERTRDQALEASRLKSEFLATMSHEIRTPMNGVIGMTEMLAETNLDAEQRELTSVIQGEAESLLQIINDILDFSKIEAGMLLLDEIDFDPRQVVESVVAALAAAAASRGVALISFVAPDVPARLCGDPIRLRQVLTNLVGNAVKFTEHGDVIVRMIVDREAGSPWSVRCFVSDSGIGIAHDVLIRLFEPFTQADGSITRKYGGTGLGLAICRRLAQLMGGEIGAESEAGQGSTFWFTACFARPRQEVEATQVTQSAYAGSRILVVNDRRTEATIVQSYLDAWQLDGEVVESGAEALARLRDEVHGSRPFSAAIVAPELPDMTAGALAQAIAAVPSIAGTPLVQIVPVAEAGQGGGRCGDPRLTVVRPIRQSQLFDAVAVAMLGERAAPEVASTGRCGSRPPEPSEGGPLVLLVDDNETNRVTATHQLTRLGYRVATATNGQEAVDTLALADRSYAIVLMDCQMPEMDGFTATRAIREREHAASRHIPIVAMTANAMQGDRERCLAAGMDDYLSKPVRLEPLRAVLERWVAASVADAPLRR
jgi:PAS domain S-box-containing protein